MHSCKDCAVKFDKTTAYFNHRRKEHPKFSCSDCGKVFGMLKKYNYHRRGCAQIRRINKIHQESGSIVSISDYKRLPVVTAKELDSEFEIYMDRKFGKKGYFRNEKMCKFCSETFVMASDFADHIREHYKSIPLDATGVKSKFDFMRFMGLKIRETNDTDCSDAKAIHELKNEMAECKVVIIGERCKICSESFKCRTDLDQHTKIYHSVRKRNKIMLVLRIGKEIISKIPVKKRYIRKRISKNIKHVRFQLDEIHDNVKYSSKSVARDKTIRTSCSARRKSHSNIKTHNVERDRELIPRRHKDAQSAMCLKTNRCRLRLRNESCYGDSDMTRWSEETTGKEIVGRIDGTLNDFGLSNHNCKSKVGECESECRQIYADEFFESMEYCEPWKDELNDGTTAAWYSDMKCEEDDNLMSVDDDCYCIGTVEPRLIPKEEKSAWEQEHCDMMLNQNSENCHEISLHESPPIYKYSCDPKYQADFSFPSDEKSYGIQIKAEDIEETNNNEKNNNHNLNESRVFDYTGSITINNEERNLNFNHSESVIHEYREESCGFENLEVRQAAGNAIDKYPKSLIKEEIMLEDLYLLQY